MSVDEANQTGWRPYVRTEVGLRLFGPLELGGQIQMSALDFPARMPSFGGGVFLELRPDVALFGFVPSLRVGGGRVTLPTEGGRVDAWELNAGGGLGYELGVGIILEARVAHHWYLDLPAEGNVGVDGWTIGAGITYRLP